MNKICKRCLTERSDDSFRVSKKTGRLLNPCFDCRRTEKQVYNRAHKDLNNATKARWARNNQEKVSQSRKKWKTDNIGQVKASKAVRKEKVSQATPKWLSPLQLEAINHHYMMAELRTLTSGVKYHVDHIIPIRGENVSGLNVPWNMEVIKATENMAKSNKVLPWRLRG